MKQVSFKKEIVPKRNGQGLWIEVIYFADDVIVQKDYYNLSNSPDFIDGLVEKILRNIEQNLKDLN